MIAPDFRAGEVLSAADLDTLAAMAEAAQNGSYDGASGIEAVALPSGTAVRGKRPLEVWVLITAAGTGGVYGGTQQLEEAGGAWADGPRVWTVAEGTLKEINANPSVPAGGTRIVRAYRDRLGWYFQYAGSS